MITRLIIIMAILSLGESSGKKVKFETPYKEERFLIITADDYGASLNINNGIKQAAKEDLITTISALTNFPESLATLKSLSEEYPNIGIGVHLNITTGKPVSDPFLVPTLVKADGNFYTINEILPHLRNISLDELRIELLAQIQQLSAYGIRIDHLSDQHGILSLYPPFFNIIIELAKEFNVPLRSPVIASMKYPGIFPHSFMKQEVYKRLKSFLLSNPGTAFSYVTDFQFREINNRTRKLDREGVLYPDVLIDYFYGNPTATNLKYIMENLPPGINELVLHLGTEERQNQYPCGLDVSYFPKRELELMTVSKILLNDYLQFMKINKSGYSGIGKFVCK